MSTSTLFTANLNGMSIQVLNEPSAIRENWLRLQNEKTCSIFQDYRWVSTAYASYEANNKPIIIYATRNDKAEFILPLVLEKKYGIGVLKWPGGTHANIGCALYSKSFLENCAPWVMRDVLKILAKTLPGPLLLWLKNQPEQIGEYPNPLLCLPHQKSPNPAFPINLSIGLDGILDQGNGKKKRKLFRRQCREAEKLGGFKLVTPIESNEINAVVDRFLILKNERLKELGANDIFACEKTEAFLRNLALIPEKNGIQPLRFFVLEIGGELRALMGCGIIDKHCHALINAVVLNDEFSNQKPGEMILYLLLQHLVDNKFEHFDYGIGWERYKYSWCKTPAALHETTHAMGIAAIPLASTIRLLTNAKTRIKASPVLWNMFKRLRRLHTRLQTQD